MPVHAGNEVIQRIAFGSCAQQNKPQPIWRAIGESRPDLFIFSGDNVYADTDDEIRMRASYRALASKPGFRALRRRVPLLATWDDHDFGKNDGGEGFNGKAMAQRVFTEFFEVPKDDPRRRRPGIYSAHRFGPPGRTVQVVLLDTRYFRSPLKKRWTRYVAHEDASTTLLGQAQWQWLIDTLREPADLRILVSSIQVLSTDHHREKWANFPHERRRLLRLLSSAGPVILISGDRHFGEIQRLRPDPDSDFGHTVYEVTASGLNTAGKRVTTNGYRLGSAVQIDHFGLIEIDWAKQQATLSLIDWTGVTQMSHRASFHTLDPIWIRPVLAAQISPEASDVVSEFKLDQTLGRRDP